MQLRQKLNNYYEQLLKSYGCQGWWPLTNASLSLSERSKFINGYHPGEYGFPKNSAQKLEVCLGAILTQNTKWQNVVVALNELSKSGLLSLEALQKNKSDQIALAIKSAGYYNQKAKTIRRLVSFLGKHSFKQLQAGEIPIVRKMLLDIKGIGPETADCILLYALDKISFVVDAYTKRICVEMGIIGENAGYEELKSIFESSLEPQLIQYQEYHALLVQHGKLYYSRKPYGMNDPLLTI